MSTPTDLTSFAPVRFAGPLGLLDAEGYTVSEHRAAMLIADISGFSALADGLEGEGGTAADTLMRMLDRWFGVLVDQIIDGGGAVVTFAGDAVLASWTGGSDADLAVAALRCADGIRAAMEGAEAAPGIPIGVKVGVGLGDARAARLGGEAGRWEVVVTGEPVDQFGQALSAARQGDVVATEAVKNAATDRARWTSGGVGLWRLDAGSVGAVTPSAPSSVVVPESARSFVPQAVLATVDAGYEDWLAEIRDVTIGFVGVRNRGDAPLSLDALHEAVSVSQRTIAAADGVLDKVLIDEKGVLLMAGFGLPGSSPDRQSERALATMVRLRDALSGQGIELATSESPPGACSAGPWATTDGANTR